jgi:hypothetical protein
MGAIDILTKAYTSLGSSVNKLVNKDASETEEGIISEKMPELVLETTNESILEITEKWEKKWKESAVKARLDSESKDNENYWLGKHFTKPQADTRRPMVDNAIFEALETYLPQVTRRNPDPMVSLTKKADKENQELQQWTKDLQSKLGDFADEIVLRLKLKKQARHWAIYLLGMVKMGWDLNKNIPTVKLIRAPKLILDPDATVTEDGYTGEYIGEYREMKAARLLDILKNAGEANAVKTIEDMVSKDTGTEIRFVEWWTDEATYWTMENSVLLKKKNLHWNWDTTKINEVPGEPLTDETTGQPMLHPQTGEQIMGPTTQENEDIKGINHFTTPLKPYIPLSVFNLGKTPIDDTSLIGQNLANQDVINKRNKQIDKNADAMNGSMAVSLERSGLTEQQAAGVTKAAQNGGTFVIPTGSVQDAIARISAPGLPADIYNNLVDVRNRVKDLFGTRGSSAAGLESDTTVRGKVMNRTLDSDRIGGGFSEYLEQSADRIFNWAVQLMYVYDEEYANGQPKPKIKVTVKEGSLLPKDSTTIANQAIELANSGKMSILDLYKKLDYPNPEELAANVWLEVNAPDILYGNDPRIQQVMQMKQQQAADAAQAGATTEKRPPSVSISFKDLPPDGQAQAAAQAGIELHPEAIAAHNEFNKPPVQAQPANGS